MNDTELKSYLKQVNKDLDTTLRQMDDEENQLEVQTISTGSLALDFATGRGGWPRGRIIELFGPESGGKTTISLLAIAQAQKAGGRAAFIDAEHALDPSWAALLGVDTDKLFIEQPNAGEQALELICRIAQAFDIIVVDSVASLVPKAEIEGIIGDHAMLLQSRMLSEGLRKVSQAIGKSRCVCIFVNQTRQKPMGMGDPETTPGGMSLRFYASVRARVHKVSGTEKKDKAGGVLGHDVRILLKKNKVAPPFREAVISLYFNRGIDPVEDLINAACMVNAFNQSGAWISFKEQKWQGWEAVKETVANDAKLQDELKSVLSK